MNCSITDFGAVSDGSLQTEAIQRAIDSCFLQGGGEVAVPQGMFLTGGLRLRSHVTLRLLAGAVLLGSRDPEDYTGYIRDTVEPLEEYPHEGIKRSVYPFSRWNNAIIRALDAEDIAIIGEEGSLIDGRNCFDAQGEEGYRGPHPICFHHCRNIRLEGYTVTRGGNWGHNICRSQDITIRRVTVFAGHDGIDLRSCDNILIEDCVLQTGDDAIAGFDNNDAVIRRCRLDSSCSSLRFGGNHILVEDCTAVSPAPHGFRGMLSDEKKRSGEEADETCRHRAHQFFLYYCDHRADPRRTPGDILIRNCRIVKPSRLFAMNYDGQHVWCCNRPLTSIRFENCSVEEVAEPLYIYGDAEEPLRMELENVTVTPEPGAERVAVAEIRNWSELYMKNVKLQNYAVPAIVTHSKGTIRTEDMQPVLIVEVPIAHNDAPMPIMKSGTK